MTILTIMKIPSNHDMITTSYRYHSINPSYSLTIVLLVRKGLAYTKPSNAGRSLNCSYLKSRKCLSSDFVKKINYGKNQSNSVNKY